MTVLNRTPSDTNLLQPSKFILNFERIQNTQYFCQQVNIPGMTMGEAPFNTPFKDLKVPNDKLEYNGFHISFLLDEHMLAWQELYSWLRSMAAPTGFAERERSAAIQNPFVPNPNKRSYSDASLVVLNGLNNPTIRVQFYNTFIISLSDVEFDTELSIDAVMKGKASFYFDYFDFVKI